MNLVGKYDNILPVSSPSISYNNYYEDGYRGSLYLDCQGVFKNIFINFNGGISFSEFEINNSLFQISWNKKSHLLIIGNKNKIEMKDATVGYGRR